MGTVSRLLRRAGLKAPKPRRPKPPPPPLTEGSLKEAVEYAEFIFSTYDRLFDERGLSVKGRAYLEIGPGRNFGPQLLMVDRGAMVTVADRFLPRWDQEYHPIFYRALLARVGPSPSIERVLSQSAYDGVIDLVSAPAEDLRAIPDNTFDVVMSTAVLEHLYDLSAAAREMRRVSKGGAIHMHQIDFRDHRDFDRPLEHLLLSRLEFARLADRNDHEFGCQTRHLELVRIFEQTGYSGEDIDINMKVEDAYLDDFIPRLRHSWSSPYRRWNRDDLRAISALLDARLKHTRCDQDAEGERGSFRDPHMVYYRDDAHQHLKRSARPAKGAVRTNPT
jgi:hypothetical protein